jgi:endonuclease YncB( thermonuclease family)
VKTVGFVRFIFWLLIAVSGPGEGAQTRIIHGDTIDVDGTRYRIHGIDAPESTQHVALRAAYGPAAKRQQCRWKIG